MVAIDYNFGHAQLFDRRRHWPTPGIEGRPHVPVLEITMAVSVFLYFIAGLVYLMRTKTTATCSRQAFCSDWTGVTGHVLGTVLFWPALCSCRTVTMGFRAVKTWLATKIEERRENRRAKRAGEEASGQAPLTGETAADGQEKPADENQQAATEQPTIGDAEPVPENEQPEAGQPAEEAQTADKDAQQGVRPGEAQPDQLDQPKQPKNQNAESSADTQLEHGQQTVEQPPTEPAEQPGSPKSIRWSEPVESSPTGAQDDGIELESITRTETKGKSKAKV